MESIMEPMTCCACGPVNDCPFSWQSIRKVGWESSLKRGRFQKMCIESQLFRLEPKKLPITHLTEQSIAKHGLLSFSVILRKKNSSKDLFVY